uniref:Uncharacterized protein n=1 Tax=Antarctic circular DNA molecule TaxID=2664238 RepID=A0A5Q2F0B8_9ZZZZ|nr:hypothetical protein [Antarctic circular DNA molecule]
MAYSRRKNVKKFRKFSRSNRKIARKGRMRTPLRKLVRREIARNVENKSRQNYNLARTLVATNNAQFDLSSGPIGNIVELGPDAFDMQISQGVGQGQRIGNKIKTKKLIFKGTVVPFGYDANFNPTPFPVQGKIIIFYDKQDPTAIPSVQANGNFFQDGSTSKGLSGDLVDMWSPYNTDRYRVVASKTYKLGYATNEGTGAQPGFQNGANNDFKLNYNFSFNLTKHYPQGVLYNDTSAAPTSRGLFAMFLFAPASGNIANAVTRFAGVQYMQDYVYEDA